MSDAYGEKIFIGREEELALFEQLLNQPAGDTWILQLIGPGGIGKTQLLHRFVEIIQARNQSGKNILVTGDFIDLYWTRNQGEVGILKSIANQLATEHFDAFHEALRKYEELLGQDEPDRGLVIEHEGLVKSGFVESFAHLETETVVLLFDTTEIVNDALRQFWGGTLGKIKQAHKKTIAIVSGREEDIGLPATSSLTCFVKAFNVEDVQKYFACHKIDANQETLVRLTGFSQGRPIFIALSLDWMRSGNTLEELVDCTSGEFERAMVNRVQQLHFPDDQAILAMAYFHRRFNAEIMASIFDQNEKLAQKSLESIQHFSFIKYRQSAKGKLDSCLLHDEMRDLVKKHVWSSMDPLFEYRKGWANKIVQYYDAKIEQERNILERRNLQLERLYYYVDADFNAGFDYSRVLFNRALETSNRNWMDAINREFERVQSRLTASMQREIKFRIGALLHIQDKYAQAIEVLTSLLLDPDLEIVLQGSTRAYLIEAYVLSGTPKKAIKDGFIWEAWFEELLEDDSLDVAQHCQLRKNFGWLCNVIGMAYSYQNNLSATEKYYIKALQHFEMIENAHSRIASTKTNLGFIYHKLGRDDEALSHCRIALRIRNKLDSDDLGFSYNVIGMIYMDQMRPNEAVDYFERAKKAFELTGSSRGHALVSVAYGRLMRQWGRYKEQYAGEKFDPDREEYRQATVMLKEAVTIFREQHDLGGLSEVLNEFGTLLRQQERWEQAIGCFEESAALSEQIGNQHRYVDNLTDIAILHDYEGQAQKALDYAQKAGQLIVDNEINAYTLFAKARQIVANVLFEQGDFENAFIAAADACVYITRLDPNKVDESPAKREAYYSYMADWLEDKILRLPTHELVKDKTKTLIERWQAEESGGHRLVDSYPGFITRMYDLAQNYPFLKVED